MLKKSKNYSADSIKLDEISDEIRHLTSAELELHTIQKRIEILKAAIELEEKLKVLKEKDQSKSVTSFDTDASRKYPITLEQARKRALKRIKMAKELKLLSDENE